MPFVVTAWNADHCEVDGDGDRMKGRVGGRGKDVQVERFKCGKHGVGLGAMGYSCLLRAFGDVGRFLRLTKLGVTRVACAGSGRGLL